MNRNITSIMAVVMLAASSLVATAAPATAVTPTPTTHVVDGDGQGTLADCDATTAAFTSIQAAIDDASTFDGDTIYVCPGTYPATTVPGITVDKALTIQGSASADVIVDGSTSGALGLNDVLFDVTASNVTIKQLTIDLGDDDDDYGVGIFTPNDGTVSNLTVQNSSLRFANYGSTGEQLVHLGGGSGHTIDSNSLETASGNSVIYLGEGANTTMTITANTINTVSDTDGGGTAINAFGPVTNSTISNNTFQSTGIAVYLGSGSTVTENNVISGNTFAGNTSTVYAPIVITSEVDGTPTRDITVTQNVFSGSAGPAVRVFDWDATTADVDGDTIVVNDNSIAVDNVDGLIVGDGVTGIVDGECNWWGASDGPSTVGPGSGATVSAGVDYSPWRTSSSLTSDCPAAPTPTPTPVPVEPTFDDLDGLSAEAITAIETLVDLGVTTGTDDTSFSPAMITERWQMALFLTRVLTATGTTLPTGEAGFSDLSGYSTEAQTAMNQLANLGISVGTSPDEFSPSGNVTRWQMALFLVRTLEASGVTLPSADQSAFTDLAEYPDEVQDAVDVLVTLGITTGTTESTFSPEVELPRWQMALFLARVIEVIQTS